MAQWIKHSPQANDSSLIPRTHVLKGQNNFHQLPSVYTVAHTCALSPQYACVFVYVCIRERILENVCDVYTCVCAPAHIQRLEENVGSPAHSLACAVSVSVCHLPAQPISLSCSPETGSLIEPGSRLQASKPQLSSCLCPTPPGIVGTCGLVEI